MRETAVVHIGEKNRSSWSMRAWVALAYKGVPFEERFIPIATDVDRSQRRKVSPTGRVPVLHHRGLVIPDSLAILEYLEETYPPPRHPAIWPADRADRARARWLAATMHSGYAEVRASMSFNLCFLPERPPASPEALREAREMLELFERSLGGNTTPGPYLVGPFSGADIMFATAAWRLVAFGVPTEETPKAAAYLKVVLEHPAVKRWMDEARSLPPSRI